MDLQNRAYRLNLNAQDNKKHKIMTVISTVDDIDNIQNEKRRELLTILNNLITTWETNKVFEVLFGMGENMVSVKNLFPSLWVGGYELHALYANYGEANNKVCTKCDEVITKGTFDKVNEYDIVFTENDIITDHLFQRMLDASTRFVVLPKRRFSLDDVEKLSELNDNRVVIHKDYVYFWVVEKEQVSEGVIEDVDEF